MKISHGRSSGASRRGETTFTGSVFLDPVLENRPAVAVNDVIFAPGGRTHWHSHADGQVLIVKAGEGYVGNRSGEVEKLKAGDVVHADAGEEHWHGAGANSFLLHQAVSLGTTTWLEELGDVDFRQATGG